MKVLTATNARSNLFQMVKESVKSHRSYQITSKEGDAVLLSKEDYEGLLETLELLSIPGMLKGVREAKEDIKKGEPTHLKKFLADRP